MDTAVDAAVIRARGNWLKSSHTRSYFYVFYRQIQFSSDEADFSVAWTDRKLLNRILRLKYILYILH